MKRITVPCFVNGQPSTFDLYIGDGAKEEKSPIGFQISWCKAHSIHISQEAQKSIETLWKLAILHRVSFEELTVLAFVLVDDKQKPFTTKKQPKQAEAQD